LSAERIIAEFIKAAGAVNTGYFIHVIIRSITPASFSPINISAIEKDHGIKQGIRPTPSQAMARLKRPFAAT